MQDPGRRPQDDRVRHRLGDVAGQDAGGALALRDFAAIGDSRVAATAPSGSPIGGASPIFRGPATRSAGRSASKSVLP